jgi:metallopeptidase family M12-like protein
LASLRQLAACIGVNPPFSVLGNFFGFRRGALPTDPSGATASVSLLNQARLLQGPHFHLNVIDIGSDQFTGGDDMQVDYSVYRIRTIYAQVNIGVGRVLHWVVSHADAGGLDTPTTTDQLTQIGHRWVVNNDGVDIAIPVSMNVASNGGQVLGQSPEPGPCVNKDDKGMNGSVVGLFGSEQTARSFAHEIGHNLGLDHRNGTRNLMAQTSSIPAGVSLRDAEQLANDQGNTIKGHCLMRAGC